ncbi:tripartite tricarboxylate transporter substrate binding protein [Ramlibacter sp.]|uniref:tripartite tricarboxylate transporter substrate binding protein n=1 Tax=Ramlibacter sp. TaxID=1917967 RepID=UPI003D0BDBE2
MTQHHDLTRRSLIGAAGGLALAGSLPAAAQSDEKWPTRPVKLVVAVGPGSSSDTLMRLIAPRLETIWKQPVIVENKPGAGGIVGTEYVLGQKDNHTFLYASQSSYLPKFTRNDLRYDPFVDLMPVYKAIEYQIIVASNADTVKQAKTFLDIVKLSKASDKGLFFSGTGPSSIFNVTMALVNKPFGLKYSEVNFNSVPQMNTAVLRNDAQLVVNTPSSVRAHFDSGAIVPVLAVSRQRYPELPNVPAAAELPGFGKSYLPVVWNGMVAPKGTPQHIVDRLARDLRFILNTPDVKKQIETQLSGQVQDSSPAKFAKELRDEYAVWKELFSTITVK